jgi:hypothetical protein
MRNIKLLLFTVIALIGSQSANAEVALAFPGEKFVFETNVPSSVQIDMADFDTSGGMQTFQTWYTDDDGAQVVASGGQVEITMPQTCTHNDGITNITYYNPKSGAMSVLSFRLVTKLSDFDEFDYDYLDNMPMSGNQFKMNFVSRSNPAKANLTVVKTKGTPISKPKPRYPRIPSQFPDKVRIGPWDKRWDPTKTGDQWVFPQNGDSVALKDPADTDGDPWTSAKIEIFPTTTGTSIINQDGSITIGAKKVELGGSYAQGTSIGWTKDKYVITEYYYEDVFVWKDGKWVYLETRKTKRVVQKDVITVILPDGTTKTIVIVTVIDGPTTITIK